MKTLCVALVLACFLASVLANHPNSFPYKGANGYPSPRRPNLPAVVDFVVVGSGPSGSALASRLSQSGAFNVMLLERGSDVSSIQMYQVPLGWEKTPVSQADRPTQIDIRSEPQVAWVRLFTCHFSLIGDSSMHPAYWMHFSPYSWVFPPSILIQP